METSANPFQPVESLAFSTAGSHRGNGIPLRFGSVFPVVHTPYDFYERI